MRATLTRVSFAVLALAVSGGGILAADKPGAADAKSRAAAILAQFPAQSAAQKDALCAQILGLGPEALTEICARVLPTWKGDDSRARFAVNGLAVYVTRPGAEAERAVFARVLLESLARTQDPTLAAFFLSQLQLAGKREAIRPLEKYLVDDALAGPAAAALLAIGGPRATQAMLKALDEAPRDARLALLQAIGETRSREAVRRILPFADSADEGLRQAALFALANGGDPAAGPALARSRVTASHAERSQAPSLYLLHARRLVESGHAVEGLAAARTVLASYQNPSESQHASAALALVVSTLGAKALPELLLAATSPDRAFRGSALALADSIPGSEATARWVAAATAAPSDVRADIVAMLGRRGDAAALPFVRESLRGSDASVRLVAIPAAVRLGGPGAFPDLLPLLDAAGADEIAALKAALLGYPAPLVVPEAARRLDSAPAPAKAALIEVLGEKGARGEVGRVFRLTEDEEPVIREAAFKALVHLAGDEDLPRLVAMLESTTQTDAIVRLREAIAAAVLRNPDSDRRAQSLLVLLRGATANGKAEILRVLPRIGGARPLQAAVEEAASPDAEVRSAAIGALSRWPDVSAADELLRLAAATPSREQARLAIQGYARLVARSSLPADRRLAALEKAMALAGADDADKRAVLSAIASVRDPGSLRLLARSLDEPGLREAAAAAVIGLAARQSPEERWLSGHQAYSVLRRAEAALSDPAARERADRIIRDRLREGGFVPLFDGVSLEGWKGLVADPPKRALMTAQELARAQAAADEKMRAHWTAAAGVLAFDGKGESLCSARDYGDFELLVDWKIEKGGDSGVYLRGSPQVQIWDAEANPVGSGGLFNNEKRNSQPLGAADRPVGEWNAFRIVMIGERVTVYLNDQRVVDNTVLENYWERGQPIYASGPIELQAHGNPLWFRNVFVREIPREADAAAAAELDAGEGFLPLFNGRDLAGWTGGGAGYTAEDGKIVVHPERGGGNLYTEKEYADFVLRFDFKLTPAANNGLGIRAPLEGDAAYAGMELQILEDGSPVYWGLQPYQYHGSVYGIVPARRGVLMPVGEWNRQEVTVKGRRVSVVVNGTTVVDADLDEASASGTMDGKDHPGLKRAAGHIGFLGHGSPLEFRNIRIKELP